MEGISEYKHRFRDLLAHILCSKPLLALSSLTNCLILVVLTFWTSVFKLPVPLRQILIKILFGQSQKTSSGGRTIIIKKKRQAEKIQGRIRNKIKGVI